MNFLALANRLKMECGATLTDLTSVTGQTGDYARFLAWINTAWMDIQTMRTDWMWMRSSVTFNTVAGQGTYANGDGTGKTGLADFGAWYRDTFRNYDTAAGLNSEICMEYMDYDDWRDVYQMGSLRNTQSRPIILSIAPDKSICLGPIPAAGYTILGEYSKVPTELAASTDTPSLPIQYHMMIVYKAMISYGMYESAQEVVQRGQTEFDKMVRRLLATQSRELT